MKRSYPAHRIFLYLFLFMLLPAAPAPGQIILNEFLADPPAGTAGDANRDGTRHSSQDEFIELVNTGAADADLGGWHIADATRSRHVFPAGTVLPAGAALVIFGGGSPQGDFSGATVQTASTGTLSLNNSGDTISLITTQGDTVLSYQYGSEAGKDESLSRAPDITGEFTRHSSIAAASGALFSPGSKVDGTPFSQNVANNPPVLDPVGDKSVQVGDTLSFTVTASDKDGDALRYSAENLPRGATFTQQEFTWIPDSAGTFENIIFRVEDGRGGADADTITITVTPLATIVINEILADPPAGQSGDANGDGTRHSSEDEFIELVNGGDESIDISGWSLSDAARVRHIFPAGTQLGPGDALLVFGGGMPSGTFGHAHVHVAESGGLSLNNTGDTITLSDASGRIVDSHTYGKEAGKDQSLVRSPDIDGEFVKHNEIAGTPFSAGTKSDGTPFPGVANIPPTLAKIEDQQLKVGDSLRFTLSAEDADGDSLSFEAANLPAGARFVGAEFFWRPQVSGIFGPVVFTVRDGFGGSASDSILITVIEPAPPAVVINEVFPNLAGGDANGDGEVSSADRFIELVNVTDQAVDIGAFTLRAGGVVLHRFAAGTILPPREAFVVFSGGTPRGYFGYAGYKNLLTTASSGALALPAERGEVSLYDAEGRRADSVRWRDETATGSAIVRDPEFSGEFTPHSSIKHAFGAKFSPGYRTDGAAFSAWQAFQDGAVHIGGGRVALEVRDRTRDAATGLITFKIALRLRHAGALVAPITLRLRIQSASPGLVTISNADLADTSQTDKNGYWFNFTRFVGDDFLLTEGERSAFREVHISNPGGEKFSIECTVMSLNYFSLAKRAEATGESPTAVLQFEKLMSGEEQLPQQLTLYGNFPNPFNPHTVIRFALPADDEIRASILNSLGQEIRLLHAGRLPAGHHSLRWDGTDERGHTVASGLYLLVIRSSGGTLSHKMLLSR